MGKIILTVVLVAIILALGITEQIFMQRSFDDLAEKCAEVDRKSVV